MPDEPDFLRSLRDVLRREVPPSRVRADDEAHRPPLDLLEMLGETGYLSVGLPAEWDGVGSLEDIVHLMVELGRTHLGLGHLVGRSIYAEQILLDFGTSVQQHEWVPRLRAGTAVFCVAITKPDAGSDAAAVRTRATVSRDGYLLTGQKLYSSSMAYADVAMVLARTSDEGRKQEGLTAFLVDPKADGVEVRQLETLGDWTIGLYETYFTKVALPASAVLGEVGGGWRVITGHLARERLVMAARAVGATEALLAEGIEYVCQRQQFDHPLADFQVLRHRLADISIDLRMARAGLFDVAARASRGQASASDAAAVKIFTSEMYVRTANIVLQMMGGFGYTRESAVQRHLRDARVYVVGGGSSEVLRDVVARDLLRQASPPSP